MLKKIRRIVLIAVLLLGIAANVAKAQVFKVMDFDGTNQQITVLANGEKEILKIVSLKDTIIVNARFIDFLNKVSILNGRFLRIDYGMMAGSDIHVARTIIVCLTNQHLVESLHVTSFFREAVIDFSKPVDKKNPVSQKSIFRSDMELSGASPTTYQITANIHESKRLRDNPKKNYNHFKKIILAFDPKQAIFYSTHETLRRNFRFFDRKVDKYTKKYNNGTFPTVILGKTKCYYINGRWCESNGYGDLSELSYRFR